MDGVASAALRKPDAQPLTIGLVNSMAASGMAVTYEQFSTALADTGYAFKLRHLTLKDERDAPPDCTPIEFPGKEIAALIVTGMEPVENDLRNEWLWPRLVSLHDWCERNSIPVIWSCLSAHAAVLHSDRILRRRLDTKLSGVFGCERVASHHALLQAMPEYWECPHSRYNDLAEEDLVARGYTILSRAGSAGVDIFTRTDGTPFFYFQGHPEYQHDTLLREFMRDKRRFVSGESKIRPALPIGYADEEGASWCARQGVPVVRPAAMAGPPKAGWQAARSQLFINWMEIALTYAGRSDEALTTTNDRKQNITLCTAAHT